MENLEFKGTKGEWFYHQETPRTFRIGSDQHYRDKIIKVWSDDCISNKCSLDEAESNAKLIAAAPDLLEALQRTQRVLAKYNSEASTNAYFLNQKAIEKALK